MAKFLDQVAYYPYMTGASKANLRPLRGQWVQKGGPTYQMQYTGWPVGWGFQEEAAEPQKEGSPGHWSAEAIIIS